MEGNNENKLEENFDSNNELTQENESNLSENTVQNEETVVEINDENNENNTFENTEMQVENEVNNFNDFENAEMNYNNQTDDSNNLNNEMNYNNYGTPEMNNYTANYNNEIPVQQDNNMQSYQYNQSQAYNYGQPYQYDQSQTYNYGQPYQYDQSQAYNYTQPVPNGPVPFNGQYQTGIESNTNTQTNKTKKVFKKKYIPIICGAVVALIAIIVVIILLTRGENKRGILYVEDGNLYAWYNEKVTKVKKFDEEEYNSLKSWYSSSSRYIAYVYDDSLFLYDFKKESNVKVTDDTDEDNILFSNDDKYLFYVDEDEVIYKYLIGTGTKERVFKSKKYNNYSTLLAVSNKKMYFGTRSYSNGNVIYSYDYKESSYDKIATILDIYTLSSAEKILYTKGEEESQEVHAINLKNDKDELIATNVLDVFSGNQDYSELYFTQKSNTKVDILDDDEKGKDPVRKITGKKLCTFEFYMKDFCSRNDYYNDNYVEMTIVEDKKIVNDEIREYFDELELFDLVRYKDGKTTVLVKDISNIENVNDDMIIFDKIDTSNKLKISNVNELKEAKAFVENNTILYFKKGSDKETPMTFGDEKETENVSKGEVSVGKKVNIYLFYGKECSHCERFLNWFDGLDNTDKNKINLVKYETWSNYKNSNLMDYVAKEFYETANGVPVIVIGDNYIEGFSGGEQILDIVNEEYKKEKESRYDLKNHVNLSIGEPDEGCIVETPNEKIEVKQTFKKTIDEYYLDGSDIYFLTYDDKLYQYDIDKKDYGLIDSDVRNVIDYSEFDLGVNIVFTKYGDVDSDYYKLSRGKAELISKNVDHIDPFYSENGKIYIYNNCDDKVCDYSLYDGKNIEVVLKSVYDVVKESGKNYFVLKNYDYDGSKVDIYYNKDGVDIKIANNIKLTKTSVLKLR